MTKFDDRKNRLTKIMDGIPISIGCPLLYESKLQENHFRRLKYSVIYYVYVSLVDSFPSFDFELCENLLDRYEDLVNKLPNVTPNGLILPKQENFLSYHEIHKAVANILDLYGFYNKAKLIHAPINIRLVRGNQDASSRPKASTKLHTDIWAGEFSNSLMVFMPLLGDIDNIGVDFYEPPQEFYPEYVKVLDDYDQGGHLILSSDKYDCPLKNGYFYLIDSFLLHKTIKKSNRWRLSLDFRFLPYEDLISDIALPTARDENYICYEDWRSIGKTNLLFTDLPIDKYDAHRDKNAYASKYEIIRFK